MCWSRCKHKVPNNGMTPLIMAVDNQKLEVIRILLAAKASVYEESNDNGSALTYAVTHGNKDIVRIVLQSFNFKSVCPKEKAMYHI